jgi:hypothetical protein
LCAVPNREHQTVNQISHQSTKTLNYTKAAFKNAQRLLASNRSAFQERRRAAANSQLILRPLQLPQLQNCAGKNPIVGIAFRILECKFCQPRHGRPDVVDSA